MAQQERDKGTTALRVDLIIAKVLVWVASVGRDAELTEGAHLYFFLRYQRLANYHRQRGHDKRAAQLQARADEHYRRGGGGGPPYAAAMGMPRPSQWFTTDAVAQRQDRRGPDDAA